MSTTVRSVEGFHKPLKDDRWWNEKKYFWSTDNSWW